MESILTENILITKFISTLIIFMELAICHTFLNHSFNLKINKLKTSIFFLICFPLETLSIWTTPVVVFPIINTFIAFLFVLVFYEINFTQKVFILVIPLSFFLLLESLFMFIISIITNIPPISLANIPIVRPLVIFPTYFFMFLLLDFLKKLNISEFFSCTLSYSSKFIINLFSICIYGSVLMNHRFIYMHFTSSTLIFIVLNIFLITLLLVLVLKMLDLNMAKKQIECEKKSYDILSSSYDGIRCFKHDFSNIMQAIGGYIITDDLEGLKKYYSSVFKECSELKKLSIFNKDVLNSPPIFSLIVEKYYKAKELGIDFNIEVFVDLNNLNMNIFEFSRILGIFLDNSIEAASQSSKRIVNIIISKDFRNHFDLITVENSCDAEFVDIEKIFEKNFSTKPKNSGLGLWNVKSIITKYDNVSLNTSLNNHFFRHQLKIYY